MVFRHLGLDFAGRGPVERSLQVSFYLGFRRGGEGRGGNCFRLTAQVFGFEICVYLTPKPEPQNPTP